MIQLAVDSQNSEARGVKRELSILEAAQVFNKSQEFIRKYIRAGVIPVKQFAGKPLKPYVIVYKDLESLFTVATLGSLTIEDLGKQLGRKPLKKEVFKWPE